MMETMKITSHSYLKVTCDRCGKTVFAIEDTTLEKRGTVNMMTETGVTVVFICETCKAVHRPTAIYFPAGPIRTDS